jgi:hypothetical protein
MSHNRRLIAMVLLQGRDISRQSLARLGWKSSETEMGLRMSTGNTKEKNAEEDNRANEKNEMEGRQQIHSIAKNMSSSPN